MESWVVGFLGHWAFCPWYFGYFGRGYLGVEPELCTCSKGEKLNHDFVDVKPEMISNREYFHVSIFQSIFNVKIT